MKSEKYFSEKLYAGEHCIMQLICIQIIVTVHDLPGKADFFWKMSVSRHYCRIHNRQKQVIRTL